MFAGIAEHRYSYKLRPAAPLAGTYLFSKARPDQPGPFHPELLFSPRVGSCPRDASLTVRESHRIRGWRFVLPLAPGGEGDGWRECVNCQSLFWDAAGQPSVCHKGGGAHVATGPALLLRRGPEGPQQQDHWHHCGRCGTLYWDDGHQRGLCPAGGVHGQPGPSLVLPRASFNEDRAHQDRWRFCGRCAGLFRLDFSVRRACPAGGDHEPRGLEFVLPHRVADDERAPGEPDEREDAHHQRAWRCCGKCGAMFWEPARADSRCPADQGLHDRAQDPINAREFFLPFGLPPDDLHQSHWRFCVKCCGMFWDGDPHFKGVCPRDGRPHEGRGNDFVLAHNPGGGDGLAQDGWRFCESCFGLVRADQPDMFAGVAPWVVRNADHPYLPQGVAEHGVVLLGFGYQPRTAFRLAWMPLREGRPPRLEETRYYVGEPAAGSGDPGARWSSDWRRAADLFGHEAYTSVSLAWLDGPRRWLLLYSNANDVGRPDGHVVARFGETPWSLGDEVSVFDPAQAHGVWIHKEGRDTFNLAPPPAQPPPSHDGWPYGAFFLERFSTWDEPARELTLSYLLSPSSPYQVQLMRSRLRIPAPLAAPSPTASRHRMLLHGGNGTSPLGELTLQGVFFGVTSEGHLEWNRYTGAGLPIGDPAAARAWDARSGNWIGRGFGHLLHVFGCGDGVVMAIHPNGNVHWFSYGGAGESDETGTLGWRPNSGNVIGNGWQHVRLVFVAPRAGPESSRLKIFAVMENGDLRWFSYSGNGEEDPSGSLGWHPNSGNVIGNGWQAVRRVHGSDNVFFVVHESGNLLWYSYAGHGEEDPPGSLGWHPNSGNPIGRGWEGMQHLLAGSTNQLGGYGHIVMAVDRHGDLRWYHYRGQGEFDVTGTRGWHPRSGNVIGRGW